MGAAGARCRPGALVVIEALGVLLTPATLAVIMACAVVGLVVGAIPGLSASMAVALFVPFTYFLDPVPALAGVVTLAAMAVFAGDIPAALLRIPGTPASAAYVDETYRMTQRGEGALALGTSVICSAIGGIAGGLVLLFAAPQIAKMALHLSSVEYFWLACIGLSAAVLAAAGDPAKGALSLLIGLTIAMIGLDPVSGMPRFTFGRDVLVGGLGFIPVLVGFFAVSQVLRFALHGPVDGLTAQAQAVAARPIGIRNLVRSLAPHRWSVARGCGIGTLVGAIPGAGADIAAYLSYASARLMSRKRHLFGTGVIDGIAPATAANNASIGGALVPATVLGIPGDSVTAIVIGILFMKGLNPGPMVFVLNAKLVYGIFLAYLLANILMIPLGLAAVKASRHVLRIPRALLMPLILAACVVGAFAVENTTFAITTALAMGILGFLMESRGIPLAPAILGIVLGPIVEETFITSLIKSDGDFSVFFSRPLAAVFAGSLMTIWIVLLFGHLKRASRPMSNENV